MFFSFFLSFFFFQQIKKIFERIQDGMVGKPFLPHVVQPYYAIENKRGASDPGVRVYARLNVEICVNNFLFMMLLVQFLFYLCYTFFSII